MDDRDNEFSMDAIVATLKAAGIVAYVEQTGGGCATIFASRTADEEGYPYVLKDQYGESVAEVIAGPGWFDGPGWSNARAGTLDFSFGADDQGEKPVVYSAVSEDTAESLAERMLAFLRGLPDRE